jgi:hypothetical protein
VQNKYFPEEEIDRDDLYYTCYIIERVARHVHQHNKYVVNKIGKDELYHLISCAKALHCENPQQTEVDLISQYGIEEGVFDISKVNTDLIKTIPAPTQIGKVYCRLILNTLRPEETYVDGIVRVYNNPICDVIDNYNCSAFYEPSYVIARAYQNGGF